LALKTAKLGALTPLMQQSGGATQPARWPAAPWTATKAESVTSLSGTPPQALSVSTELRNSQRGQYRYGMIFLVLVLYCVYCSPYFSTSRLSS
jgi:hypothetical protein